MILSKRVRLRPTKEQEEQLKKSAGTSRFIYNWTLNKQEENYRNGGKFIQDGVLRKEITKLKQTPEYNWLYDVSNDIAKQSIKDACNAYKRFFKKKSGKPKFKKKDKCKESFFNDNFKLKSKNNKTVLILKVGWVKTSEQIPINTKYYNPRIVYDNKYWYLTVGIEVEKKDIELTDEVIGIDLGIKELAVCSNEDVYPNVNKTKEVKRLEKKIRRLQRKLSKKYEKGGTFAKTSNIIKINKQIQMVYRRLRNIRENYLHQVTTKIVKTKPSKIVIEDLNVSGMMKNKYLSKSIQDQCFYKFKKFLEYKCELYGIELIIADRFYPSSKKCSNCGNINKELKLKDRIYKCSECGLVIDRDLNASINLSNYELA